MLTYYNLSNLCGGLQSKDLPAEIRQYQTQNNGAIASYTTSIFLKIRL
ncbi:MAG: hypothetical protein Q4Q06_04095 [Bacteroidota bacterium]|nr:hypothetical protein [Bacteroidota bacterium]